MPSNNNLVRDIVQSLEAQIDVLRGDKDGALRRLFGETGAHSIRRRLAILLEMERFDEIVQECKNLVLDEFWIEYAVAAYAALGRLPEASRMMSFAIAQDDRNLLHRTASFAIDGTMRHAFQNRVDGEVLVPALLSATELAAVHTLIGVVSPVCEGTLNRGRIETQLELHLALRYFDLLSLTGERETANRVLSLLIACHPLPTRVGEILLQGVAKTTRNLAERLWDEHPHAFRARFLTCLLIARKLNSISEATEKALSLESLAKTRQESEDLCELLYELSNSAEGPSFGAVRQITERLLGAESELLLLFVADHLVQANQPREALDLLATSKHQGDLRWVRTFANAQLVSGNRTEGLSALQSLARSQPSPEVLHAIARLARENDLIQEEQVALRQVLALDPQDTNARRRLAILLIDAGEYLESANHLELLRESDPVDEVVTRNLALSYFNAGETQQALTVLEAIASLPVESLCLYAHILTTVERHDQAFKALLKERSRFWSDPTFVLSFMELAHATAHEDEAHQALERVIELQSEGAVDASVMRSTSIEEIRDWISESANRRTEINRRILRGEMMWILAAALQKEVPLWAWLLKTQPLKWVGDNPVHRAAYTIYATNCFYRRNSLLEAIEAPSRGMAILVDLSALITLAELEIFDLVAAYFGAIFIPTNFLAKATDDSRRLIPHQRSQELSVRDILAAVRNQEIAVITNESPSREHWTFIDEYGANEPTGPTRACLHDLYDSMHRNGLLNDSAMDRAMRTVRRRDDSSHTDLLPGSSIVIASSTLTTIHALGMFQTVLGVYAILITEADHDEFVARLHAFDALGEARAKHFKLWNLIRSDNRVQLIASGPRIGRASGQDVEDDESMTALRVASQRDLALLADDRVSQMVAFNERPDREIAPAFGTDAVVVALMREGSLQPLIAARLLMRMIRWRYKFVIVPPEAMKALALQYQQHPPGSELKELARYVHDCMRDPGLFAGQELTNPPISIAVQLYQAWAKNIGDLLANIWQDEDLPELFAQQFSEWAIAELLPSPPGSIDARVQAAVASYTPMTVLTRASISFGYSRSKERANRGLQCIAAALGLDPQEYLDLIARIVSE